MPRCRTVRSRRVRSPRPGMRPICRPTQQVLEPDLPQWRVQTDLAYDGFGNLETQTVSSAQSAGRTSGETTWSADGRFPIEPQKSAQPDHAAHVRSHDSAARDGDGSERPRDDLDSTTASARRIGETRPDQTRTDWSYAECASNCGQNRLIVTATLKGTAGGTIRSDNVSSRHIRSADSDPHSTPGRRLQPRRAPVR